MSFEKTFEQILVEVGLNDQQIFPTDEEMSMKEFFNSVDFGDLVCEEFINVEDQLILKELLTIVGKVDPISFFTSEEVRARMVPLVEDMWNLTPWKERPCNCTYMVQVFQHDLKISS